MLYSTSNKRSAHCDLNDTFHTNAFSGRLWFLQGTHGPAQGTRLLSFSNPCVCQISSTSTIHLPPSASKVGFDEFLCDVLEVTTLCTTPPSLGGAALQLRPQLRHCVEPDQDFHKPTCLTVSFPAEPATERILDFDASRCEQQCTHQRFLDL